MKLLLDLDAAAEACSVKKDTVRRAINAGRLRAKRSGENGGGKYLVSEADLLAWYEALEDA